MTSQTKKPWICAQNKALARGVKALEDTELLQLICAPHRAAQNASDMALERQCLQNLSQSSIGEFSQNYRIGIELACKLAACLELGTRHWCQPLRRGQVKLHRPARLAPEPTSK